MAGKRRDLDFTQVSVPSYDKKPELFDEALNTAINNYRLAEVYYKKLQISFENFMRIERNKAEEKFYKNLVQEFNAAIEEEFDPNDIITAEKKDWLLSSIIQFAEELLASTPNITTAIKNKENGRTKIGNPNYLKNFNKRISADVKHIMETEQIKNELYKIYNSIFQLNTGESQMTTQGLYGLLRRSLISKVVNNKSVDTQLKQSTQGYAKLFRGDLRESAGTSAINKYQQNVAKAIGEEGSNIDILVGRNITSKDKKDIVGILDNLKKLEDNITLEADLLPITNDFFGIQSKSWVMPDANTSRDEMRKNFYDIGSRATLHNQLGFNQGTQQTGVSFERGWHNSAKMLSKHIIQVLGGANVMFLTGRDKFIWTHEVISTFRQAKYYLTFYFPRKTDQSTRKYLYHYPSDPDVAWRQQMLINNYKRKT